MKLQSADPEVGPSLDDERAGYRALVVYAKKAGVVIEAAGFEVVASDEHEDALALYARHTPDVTVVGLGSSQAAQKRALALIRAIRAAATGGGTPVIALTSGRSNEGLELAFQEGATDAWSDRTGALVWKKRLPFVVDASRAIDELERSSQKLERAKRLARFATWEWDLAANRVSWSRELRDLLGRRESRSAAGLEVVLDMVHASDRARVAQKIAESVRERRPFRFDHRVHRADGVELVVHQEGDVVSNDSGDAVLVDAIVVDVTEIRKAELQIHSLANYDSLTGLRNRLSFVDLVKHARDRSERRGDSVAVALLDVDRFKEVNESLGHAAGDLLLKEVAGRLLSSVRKGDRVAREGDAWLRTVARQGGDEFLVLLSDVGQAHQAAYAARRVLDSIRRPFRINDREIFITGSIGISFGSAADATTDELLRQAEIAMYSSKEHGRNTFQFFDESMNAVVLERFEIESRLRKGLARAELALFYQPVVNARSRELVGVEALIRWYHPVRGLLSADEFVPVAEETGLIVPIGRWVLRTACEQLESWRREGLRSLRLAVNLSPRELRAPGFVAGLAKTLEDTGTNPSELELELTERGVVGNDDRILDVLRLKEMGVRLAVDDFGTGNTTFHYLKNFPLTTIKIDKSFTRGIAVDAKDAAITKALLAMAQRLQLNVVAEGVENEAQLTFLGENECDEVQGYLFGRPIPAASFADRLRQAPGATAR
jgi:diguanylate cyclase (GGDEF)-like protein/PAS domain S-box-containing protein